MAFFKSITTTTDLPPVGTTVEGRALDFKGIVAIDTPRDKRELAKDVAGFVNGTGGVLLIGAHEAHAALGRYEGLNARQAGDIKKAYETAVRERCSPVPTTDIQIISLADGTGLCLAVNCYPLADQVVGVLSEKDGGCPSYSFPYRPGEQTVWLRPEQLPMLMDPKLRRVAIRLDQIPLEERREVDVISRAFTGSATTSHTIALEAVNLEAGHVIFASGGGPGWTARVSLPLEAVEMVWRNFDRWNVLVRGILNRTEGGPTLPSGGRYLPV